MSTRTQAAVSWSGGKDSCLAAHLAVEHGAQLTALLSMMEPEADRSRSHALPRWLLEAHAAALGCELVTPRAGWPDYESVFIDALERLRRSNVGEVVFGDIDLQPHRDWEEKICAQAGVQARLPLWLWPRERVVEEIFTRGIEAVCVGVNTRFLPAEFCGRPYDREFVRDLPRGVDACGENGEFHTCVIAAPLFANRIDFRVADRVRYVAPAEHGGDEFWFAKLAASSPAAI